MKRIITLLSLLGVVTLLGLNSCVKEDFVSESSKALVDIESVTMTAHDFVLEDGRTKTAITLGNDGLAFSWSANDIVGVFPNNGRGTQVKFPISDGEVEGGSSTSNANFTGNGWAVMKAENYSSYYPFVPDMNLDMKAIPVSYIGQTQNGSGTMGHLAGYDYMLTTPTEPASNGNIGFDFKHLGVILQLEMVVPKVAEYTSLSLTCEGKPFITRGTIDITSEEGPSITATEWSDEFEIALENFATTEPNQRVVVSLIMAPDDFSGKKIKVKLKGPHASFVAHFTRAEGKPYKPGTASRPTLGELEGGEVVILSNGEVFNRAIKSLANEEEYIVEKTDYLIRNIIFRANDGSVPSNPYVDVSAPESPSPIYASWDASTGTITVSSQSYKVYANENAASMFCNLSKLQSIDMDDFAMEYTKGTRSIFSGCSSLESINLTDQDLSQIVDLNFAFEGCEKLRTVSWPETGGFGDDLDMNEAFMNCSSLTSLSLSPFSNSKITGIQEAFAGCSSLTSIDLSGLDLSMAGSVTGLFMNCTSLKSVDLSFIDWSCFAGENCWVFWGCSSLESVDLGDFYMPNAGRLDSFFDGCRNLKNIDYVRFEPMGTNLRKFFNGCESLASIDVSKMVTSRATDIAEMFWGCSSLQSIDVSGWNTSSVTVMGRVFAGTSLTELDLSNFRTFETRDMSGMFSQCETLRTITFGENFNTEKVNDMSGMFGGCTSLTSLDLSGFNTAKVLSFSEMFMNCTNLTNVEWGEHFDTHYAENFSRMFAASGFTSLDLSFFDTRSAIDYGGMFSSSKITTLDISSFTTAHTDGIGGMFEDCRKLADITMGADFNPTVFQEAFCWTGYDNDSRITIRCTPTFMNNFSADQENSHWAFIPENVTWINCLTGDPMTWPTI